MQNLYFIHQEEILDSSFTFNNRIYCLDYIVTIVLPFLLPPPRKKKVLPIIICGGGGGGHLSIKSICKH